MFGRYLHTEAVYCRLNKVQRVQVEYVVLKVERGLDGAVFCTSEAVFFANGMRFRGSRWSFRAGLFVE